MLKPNALATLECMSPKPEECFVGAHVIVKERFPAGCYKVETNAGKRYRAWPRNPRDFTKQTDLVCGELAPGDPMRAMPPSMSGGGDAA